MSCARMRRLLARHVDGELSVDRAWELEDHLASCERCRAHADELAALERLFTEQAEPTVTELDLERAVREVRARLEAGTGRAPRRRAGLLRAAVAAALVLVGGTFAFRAWIGDGGPRDAEARRDGAPSDARASGGLVAADDTELERTTDPSTRDDRATSGPEGDAAAPVPARLAAVLARSADLDDEALRAALVAVRPDRSRVRLLEDLLSDPEPDVVVGAARALGLENDLLSLGALGRALDAARDERVSLALRDALVAFGGRGAATLARGLEREDAVHALAVEGLVAIGEKPVGTILLEDWRARARGPLDGRAERSLVAALSLDGGARAFDAVERLAAADGERVFGLLRRVPRASEHFSAWLRDRDDVGPLAWRFAELVSTPEVAAWLVERVQDRRTEARALAVLEAWAPIDALALWIELEGRADLDAEERVAEAVAQDPQAAVALVREDAGRARNGGEAERSELRRWSDRLLAIGTPAAAPALRELLLVSDLLEEDRARWLALALAELGDEATGRALAEDLAAGLDLERFARAAAWLAVARSAGPDALEPLLVDLPERERRRVRLALEAPNTAGLARIARTLDRAFATVATTETP